MRDSSWQDARRLNRPYGDLDAILNDPDALLGADGSLTTSRAVTRDHLGQAIARCTPGTPPSYADRIWAELGRLAGEQEKRS